MHLERHRSDRIGWLRAAVLGANDGLISTSSLVVGVAAAAPERAAVLVAAVAGLAAGALSMAAGEYVSVSSQSDTESADVERERRELATDPDNELAELTGIYVSRGLPVELAAQVAEQLTAHDALAAHARDELGIHEFTKARPIQAALASAAHRRFVARREWRSGGRWRWASRRWWVASSARWCDDPLTAPYGRSGASIRTCTPSGRFSTSTIRRRAGSSSATSGSG